jgi:hypothetical protein
VIKALRQSSFTVDPMEDWTAAPGEPKQFSQDRVKDCDLCVLIVGFRRGHIPEDEDLPEEDKDLSVTQLEYKAAREHDIEVLVFMLKESAPWPRNFDELDKDKDKDKGIRPWRKELKKNHGVGFFDHDPTSIEIHPALTRWITETNEAAMKDIRETFTQIEQMLQATDMTPKQKIKINQMLAMFNSRLNASAIGTVRSLGREGTD